VACKTLFLFVILSPHNVWDSSLRFALVNDNFAQSIYFNNICSNYKLLKALKARNILAQRIALGCGMHHKQNCALKGQYIYFQKYAAPSGRIFPRTFPYPTRCVGL
jgi:hypothetical protein